MVLSTQGAQFRMGEIIAASWRVFSANFLILFAGYILLNLIVSVAGSVLPFIGSTILTGPMWYGLCVIATAAVRGAPVKWEDLFAGFQRFIPTCLAGAIMTLLGLACIIVLIIPAIIAIYLAWTTRNVVIFSITFSVSLTMCLVPVCAIVVLYAPAFFFIHDYNMGAWAAMEASRVMVWSNLRQWLILWAALSILHLLGLLLCCVGILISTPWMIVALAIAYEREQRLALPEHPEAG
ncbi:MAG TPA: hypothetical protein PLI09_11265 [Candidatus Hydrogenedentes bacterium]|nr:hypothetical protein [Candidatus Hydrogenedentota bacterium]